MKDNIGQFQKKKVTKNKEEYRVPAHTPIKKQQKELHLLRHFTLSNDSQGNVRIHILEKHIMY